jgi:hypothetical protein
MERQIRKAIIAGVAIGALLMLTIGAVPASAAIQDRAFTAIGCNVGDYTCFYSKMGGGGSQNSYYCQNAYYPCANGVPVANPQVTSGPETELCAGGAAYLQNGTYGCTFGNPIGTTIQGTSDPSNTNVSGGATVIIAGNFASAGLGATNITGAAKP